MGVDLESRLGYSYIHEQRRKKMNKHIELKKLETVERKAWNGKMSGSIEDASTIYGQEGKMN